jgi:hypothetical protein
MHQNFPFARSGATQKIGKREECVVIRSKQTYVLFSLQPALSGMFDGLALKTPSALVF